MPDDRAIRLVFQSTDGEVRLMRKQAVNMVAPAEAAAVTESREGVWAELRSNDSEETVYSQVLPTQVAPGMEVFSPPGEERSVQRVEAPGATQTFIVVVPDRDDARKVVLVDSRTAAPDLSGPGVTVSSAGPRELASFDLDADVPEEQ
jgi:hypothetical protein